MNSILIPIRGLDEAVEIPAHQLPQNPSDILDVLQAEVAPLQVWLKCAVGYLQDGHPDEYLETLRPIASTADQDFERMYEHARTERAQVCVSLANVYLRQYFLEKRPENKTMYNQSAITYMNRAIIYDRTLPSAHLTRGIFNLLQGPLSQDSERDKWLSTSEECFRNALAVDPNYAAAYLGKGCISYAQQKYREALEHFRKALTLLPEGPPDSRLGIAMCFYKLQNYSKAREAFERVLELDSDNSYALTALATMDLNDAASRVQSEASAFASASSSSSQQQDLSQIMRDALIANKPLVTAALKRLAHGYQADPGCAAILNHLSAHYFYMEDLVKAEAFANAAKSRVMSPRLQAENAYLLGRLAHSRENYGDAYTHYQSACSLCPDFILAQFGLAQVQIKQDKIDAAVEILENLLQKVPDMFEALKILGTLYAAKTHFDKALTLLKKARDRNPRDHETLIELARVLERKNVAAAEEAYDRARSILAKRRAVPFELYNNLGAVQLKQGKLSYANRSFSNALKILGCSADSVGPVNEATLTVWYNVARLREQEQKFDTSVQIYQTIIASFPAYLDCYLRLGKIAEVREQWEDAARWYKVACALFPKEEYPWLMMGCLHFNRRDYGAAQDFFDYVLKSHDSRNPIALLGNANIYLNFRPSSSSSTAQENHAMRQKYLGYAKDTFERVLDIDQNNVFAAVGIATVMAEQDHRVQANMAREIFNKVRDLLTEMPSLRQ